MDILDQLQDENGYVRLETTHGVEYGIPQCVIFDENENDDTLEKKIMFDPHNKNWSVLYGIDEIISYRRIEEDDLPKS